MKQVIILTEAQRMLISQTRQIFAPPIAIVLRGPDLPSVKELIK